MTIAKGQWGNWVIQHLLENGASNDRSRVLQIIMDEAVHMCLDQFSSKVVEKALRVGGSEFVDKFVQKLSTSHPSRCVCSRVSDLYRGRERLFVESAFLPIFRIVLISLYVADLS